MYSFSWLGITDYKMHTLHYKIQYLLQGFPNWETK